MKIEDINQEPTPTTKPNAYLELQSTLEIDCDLSVELKGGTTQPVQPTLIDKSITDNGEYHASDDNADGYANVTVEVPQVEPVIIEKSVTENGVYLASEDEADGYSKVSVEVPSVEPTLISKSVTDNGTYNALDDNADGYSSVSVDVQPDLAEKNITDNGTYLATGDNVDGYSKVTVNVQPTLVEKSITANGTYIASDDSAYGYSKATVNVPMIGIYTFDPVLIFDESGIGASTWTATDGQTTMTINQGNYANGAVVGEYVNTDETLTNNLCMSFPVQGSAYAFGIKVQIDPNFTPMDTNNWYDASCVLGQELGGEQRDFAVIIDKNGYFALGWDHSTIVSTTISALDGEIHTIFIIGEVTEKVYQVHLFIDGVERANGLRQNQTYWSNMNTMGVMWNKASSYSHRRVNGKVYSVGYWSENAPRTEYILPTL